MIFLGFMAVCTVVAKGIYKTGLPRVQTCRPERAALYYEINGAGVVLPGETYGVYVPEGLRVRTMLVRVGDLISEGDALFLIDMEDLEEQILLLTERRDHLAAQIRDLDNAAGKVSREKKKLEEQLLADYEGMVAGQDLEVNRAQLAMDSAWLRMENARLQWEQSDRTGSDDAGDVPAGTDAAEGSAMEDVPQDDALGEDASQDQSAALLNYELYQKEYDQAYIAVRQAELDREDAIRDWNRSLEEARESIGAETAGRVQLAGELAACERSLERLQSLKEAGGEVYALEAGTVLGCPAQTGTRTGDGACVLYTGKGDGVEVVLEESDAQLLSIGDRVTIKCKSALGVSGQVEGTVRYQESESGHKTVRIDADVSDIPAGQTVQMQYSCNSEIYDMVIPVSALHADGLTEWVYVVEPVEGILGTEYRTRKINVTVLARNSEYAAVRGVSLQAESEIISGSNKELSDNVPVRVM
ncbi:MAG: hypothetical protein NC091_07910 [Bacteroides sp.]|nr:hypothetical protein [Bacteroides sp.]